MKTFNQFISEGLLDIFKKKSKDKRPELQHLTQDQRDLIKKHFPSSNADLKLTKDEYVLPHNAHARHGSLLIAFRNEGGQLKASVAHHADSSDARNPNVAPIAHTDHVATTDNHMKDIKALAK